MAVSLAYSHSTSMLFDGAVQMLRTLGYNRVQGLIRTRDAYGEHTMAGEPDQLTAQDHVRKLAQDLRQVVDELHIQRDELRRYGIGLPPGVLSNLTQVQTGLQTLIERTSDESIELQRLRALAETTELVNSSLEIDQVLSEVMDTVISLTGAERGYIVLRDEKTGEMEYRIARNLDRESLEEGSFIVSRTIVDEVARTGEPVVTTNAQSDPRFSAQESVLIYALRSILCVPLIVRDEVTGVVYADNRIKDGLFGEKELSLLVGLSGQAAIAIENARLYRRVKMALAEVTEVKELMDNVFDSIASGVITIDGEGIVTTYNLAAERMLGTPREKVLGHVLGDALPVIHAATVDSRDQVLALGERRVLDIQPTIPGRGRVVLNLKLTPLETGTVNDGVAIVVDDLTEIRQRDATLRVVRRYLPPVMVDNIQSLDSLGLGGERRVITVMFVETRSFESFPATLRPAELMSRLNLYLTAGAEAIHNQTGVIDKFMGSEIMGLFNTQLNPCDDHALRAILAALRMAEDFPALAAEQGESFTPVFRIGIHTGEATLGNVGSASRRDFTAIGDVVNLAKRLQENAVRGQIIVSDETWRACQSWHDDSTVGLEAVELPSIQVKGRRQMARIYQVRGMRHTV